MYYLQSRYYDPALGRFINADEASNLGAEDTPLSYNLFAYCLNNPSNGQDPNGEMFITTAILIGSAILGAAAAVYTGYKMRQAGENWGDTIFYSAGAGLCAFCTVYTLGMSAYELYCSMSWYYGYEPITEIGRSPQPPIPQEAYDTYDYVTTHIGTPPKGYKGGSTFANDGRANSAILPSEYAPFKKYDIYPKTPGVDRGLERIIIGSGSGGAAWYTPDHYKTAILMDR